MPEAKSPLRRGAGWLSRRARIAIRPAREPYVRVPRVLVVMGSSESGRHVVTTRLQEQGPFRLLHTPEFLPGLCRWYPNFKRWAGSILARDSGPSAEYHVRRMLGPLLDAGSGFVPMLEFEPGADAAHHLNASTVLPWLLPEALFLHVVRNPARELADLMQGGSAPAPAEFALTWVSVVREWMQFGAREPDRYLVVARDPVVSQSEEGLKGGDALVLRLEVHPEHAGINWGSIRELGGTLEPVGESFGVLGSALGSALSFSSGDGKHFLGKELRRHVLEICAWEMITLRMAGTLEGRELDRRLIPVRATPDRWRDSPTYG